MAPPFGLTLFGLKIDTDVHIKPIEGTIKSDGIRNNIVTQPNLFPLSLHRFPQKNSDEIGWWTYLECTCKSLEENVLE